jgi:prepilin peptidase CpaA
MLGYIVILFGLVAFIFDVIYSRIPNWLTFSGAISGLLLNSYTHGFKGFILSIIAMFVGFIIMLIIYAFGAIGAGDVKLFGAIGAFIGTYLVIQTIAYSIIYAAIISVVILIYRRMLWPILTRLAIWLFELFTLNNRDILKTIKKGKYIKFPFMYAVFPALVTISIWNEMG